MMEPRFAPAALLVSIALLTSGRADAQVNRATLGKPATPTPCCAIVAVDAKAGIVSAKVNANGNVFQFKLTNPATLSTLSAGQAVYANFTNHQVSLDGRTVCCTMTSGPQAATAVAAAPIVREPAASAPIVREPVASAPIVREPAASAPIAPAPATSRAAPDQASTDGKSAAAGAIQIHPIRLPIIAYGTPQPIPSGPRAMNPSQVRQLTSVRQLTARVGGSEVTGKVLRLRGLAGIEQAAGLPDGARRLLEIHVRTLDPNESHDYIVNTELAEQWMQTHPPVPDDIKPSDGGSHRQSCSGADYVTKANCDYQAAGDAVKAVQDEAKRDWNHASDELTHDWNMAESCFADHTLPLNDIPVSFSITPGLTIPLSSVANGAGVSTSFKNGTSSGKVDGSVGLGFPLQSEFVAKLELFYIPCLPFVVRPKSLAANGTMLVGEKLTVSVTADGQFDKTFRIPPTGGPKIPIEMIPIVIAGVPVAELDVSAYIEGSVEVGGRGKAEGHFELNNPHKAIFAFACDGHGCGSEMQQIPDPTTVSESAEINGQVFVKPAVYTALQLDFDYDLLSARAGPQPYLLGMASGCVEASAQQASNGESTSEQNHALTADLDWGVELRAEALVAGKIVGNPYVHSVTGDKHIWFSDLAPGGSTALIANVQSAGPAAAAKPASYKVKMPTCYPYTNRINYRVTWTGGATPTQNPACQWQAGRGTCQFDPTKDLLINLTWPTAGDYSLTVLPVSDDHHRTFSPAPQATKVAVTVAPGG